MRNRYRDGNAKEHALSAVVFVEVKTSNGLSIGTAFHVGSGYFVTARHVIEDNEITKVGQSDLSSKTRINPDGSPTRQTMFQNFEKSGREVKRFEHPNASVDVAIIQLTGNLGARGAARDFQPSMELADNADVLTEGELLTTEVKVFGYPPIPFAINPQPPLVTSPGEICAVTTDRTDKRRHLIISSLARGGFSGGPVFLVGNPQVEASAEFLRDNTATVIGIVSRESRLETADPSDKEARFFNPGFLDTISIETVREIITHHNLPLGHL